MPRAHQKHPSRTAATRMSGPGDPLADGLLELVRVARRWLVRRTVAHPVADLAERAVEQCAGSLAKALSAGALVLGCSVQLTGQEAEGGAVNSCEQTSDCATGICQFGACVASEGDLDTLLLEITPPTNALGIGGGRVLSIVDGLSQSRDDLELNLPRVANVHGFLRSYEGQEGCLDGAVSTLPITITFTPRERALGLSGGTYVVSTTLVGGDSRTAAHPCRDSLGGEQEHEFFVSVPVGNYDVYVEPTAPQSSCEIVPSLIREGIALEAGNVCFPLAASPSSPPEQLRIVIEWSGAFTGVGSLEGWVADIVHPITGQVLSTRGTVSGSSTTLTSTGRTAYEVILRFYPLVGSQARELVRLTPPEGAYAPVIQLERSGLVATGGDALIGNLQPFPAPVRLSHWVKEQAASERGRDVYIPATVSFTATALDGVVPGIFASYSTSVEVGEDGVLSAVVLPGDYRVRVAPAVGSGLSAFETTLDVPCVRSLTEPDECAPRESEEPAMQQAGFPFFVPDAARVAGTVASPLGSDAFDGATISGAPGLAGTPVCPADAGPGCASDPLTILDRALGEDRFAPRAVSAVVSGSRFEVVEADCALCEESAGAVFDFVVRPPDGRGFPWGVRPGVVVEGDLDLGALTVPLPIVHRGRVQLPQTEGPVPIGGALIRAYAFRLADGRLSNDSELPMCSTEEPTAPSECIHSVLQVAETRAGDDGTFELALPSVVE